MRRAPSSCCCTTLPRAHGPPRTCPHCRLVTCVHGVCVHARVAGGSGAILSGSGWSTTCAEVWLQIAYSQSSAASNACEIAARSSSVDTCSILWSEPNLSRVSMTKDATPFLASAFVRRSCAKYMYVHVQRQKLGGSEAHTRCSAHSVQCTPSEKGVGMGGTHLLSAQ